MQINWSKDTKIWISSDYHFSHKNIIEFANRPFTDIHHMNNGIISIHNAYVGPEDWFFHLGDFYWGHEPEEIVDKNVIVCTNLEPKKFGDQVSDGMVLAASAENGKPILLTVVEDTNPGSQIT